jgi:hypothetical protein
MRDFWLVQDYRLDTQAPLRAAWGPCEGVLQKRLGSAGFDASINASAESRAALLGRNPKATASSEKYPRTAFRRFTGIC